MESTAAVAASARSAESHVARLYERHQRAIFGFCLRQLRRREDADDAVQTTFLYALLSLRRGVVPKLELPWLLAIARNVCSTWYRSRSRRRAHESPHDLDAVQNLLAGPESAELATTEDFREALSALPESQRQALLLREWRGLSYDEIGSALGLSQPATEALLFRARRNAAKQLTARTGLKTLNGLSPLPFLRSLLPGGAAKTAAVGTCALLTIGAVPAARPVPGNGVGRPPETAPSYADTRPHTGGGERARQARHAVPLGGDSGGGRAEKPERSDSEAAAPAARPTELPPLKTGSKAEAPDAAPAPLETVDRLVEPVTNAVPTVSLPPILVPPAIPDLPLPVQPPELPPVELPAASVEDVTTLVP